MQGCKKSLLSLAVTGVLSGTMATPTWSYDVPPHDSTNGNTVVKTDVPADESITVTEDTTLYSSDNGDTAALTIDVNDDAPFTTLQADVVINGTLNGTQVEGGSPATGSGLVIKDSGDLNTDTLTGIITVNGNIKGYATGIDIQTGILGSMTIEADGTVEATGASGTGVKISGWLDAPGDLTNKGTIKGTTAVSSASTGDLINHGIIMGAIDATDAGATLTLKNEATGTINAVGSEAAIGGGAGTVNIVNSGTIHATTIKVKDLTNTGTLTTNGATVTGDLTLTGGTLTNSGTLAFTGASTIDNGDGLINNGNLQIDGVTVTVTAGTLVAGKKLVASEGSTVTGTLDARGTTVYTEITTGDLSAGSDLLTTAQTLVDSGSSIIITMDEATYASAESTSDDRVILKSTDLEFDDGDDTTTDDDWAEGDSISVTSGNVLLNVSDVKITNIDGITADLSINNAGDVLKSTSATASTRALANDFQSSNPVRQVVTDVYGTVYASAATTSELNNYLDKIRPDDSGSAARSANEATIAAMGSIFNRGAKLRGMNFGDMQAAGSVWIQGLYGKAEQDARNGNLGYDSDLSGFTLGIDREQDDQTLGFAFSYGKSEVNFTGGREQKDEVHSYIGTLYNFWRLGHLYVDTSLSVGGSTHKANRMSGAAALSADYGSMQLGGQVLTGFYVPYGEVMVEPMAALRMSMVKVDGYSASNSANTLSENVDSVSYRRVDGGLGAAVSRTWEVKDSNITPRASLMAYRDFVGDSMNNVVSFAGTDYSIKGASAEKTSYEVRLGMDMTKGENTTFTVGYTRVMKSGFSSNNFDARLKYTF